MAHVYWDRVEEMGRWVIDTLQRQLHKRILLQQQWNRDRGCLQYRAQEGVALLTMGTGGGTLAKTDLLARAGTRPKCPTGDMRTRPAGVDPKRQPGLEAGRWYP